MGGNKVNTRFTIFRIVRIAIFTAILFVQEELLMNIPNVQFTQCLIAVYYYSFGLVDSLIIVIIHTLMDNLFIGSFNIIYTPGMLIGWISLVMILYGFDKLTRGKKINNNKYIIASIVGLHGFIYSWIFVIVSMILYEYEFLPYLISDIPFEIILVVNGFVTTMIVLPVLTKVLKKLEDKYKDKEDNIE